MPTAEARQEDLAGSDLPSAAEILATTELLAAAAHPARMLALVALRRRGPLSAGTLQQLAALEQSAMSHQLRLLREARLITAERRGKQVIYALADDCVARLVEEALAHAIEKESP